MKSVSETYQKLNATLQCFEQDKQLCDADNFIARLKAIDFLESEIVYGIGQASSTLPGADRADLIRRATVLKKRLETANESLCAKLLASIRSQDRMTVSRFFRDADRQILSEIDRDFLGYDELDLLVNDLLGVPLTPEESQVLEPDMVLYQPTPARIILWILEKLHVTADDVFYDFGSGLGHVPILVNLLTGIRTKGVEIEEGYVRYSTECVEKLGLTGVEFINADVRNVSFDDGTIFYLYTPFRGDMLRQVLAKIEVQAKRKRIIVCTYGPCTKQVARQDWLESTFQFGEGESSVGIFASLIYG